MPFPPPDTLHPVVFRDGTVHPGTVFLSAAVDHPNWEVGDYTYASAFDPPDDWAARLAPFLYPGAPETLRIGKFGQFADGAMLITASANHRYDGFSSYPFTIFDGMDRARPSIPDGPYPDTVLGHDVWLGAGAKVMPGTRLGNGVIVGAGTVVSGAVPDYAIVTGNPGRIHRMRFDASTIEALLEIAWWDWPIETILAHETEICGGDIDALRAAAAASGN